jgi:hypothetical protein
VLDEKRGCMNEVIGVEMGQYLKNLNNLALALVYNSFCQG